MKYIIGMDGGGTKTHCLITDSNNKILYECTGSASNFLVKGTEAVSETILDLINKCKNQVNIEYSDIDAVLLGTTGAGRKADAEKLENDLSNYAKSKQIKLPPFKVESDARIALEGAFSGLPGSILIAGTGSIMFGKDEEGHILRVGGFGRYLGDEGSGYAIGRKGLVAVSKQYDGRGGKTLITGILKEKFGIDSAEKLISEIYKNNFDMASAAPAVLTAGDKGDNTALKIIDEETDELIDHISAMRKKINQPRMNLSFVGGIISSNNIYSTLLRKKIAERLPDVNLQEPDYPPAMGAVLMAKKLITST